METRFMDLPIGALFVHIVDSRRDVKWTSANVYRKVSAKKYRPLNKAFVGVNRFPTTNVAHYTGTEFD